MLINTFRLALRLFPVLAASLALVLVAGAAQASGPARCGPDAFRLDLLALAGVADAEVVLDITPVVAACHAPSELEKVQVKTFALDGELVDVDNARDLASPGGQLLLARPALARGQRLEVDVLVTNEETAGTIRLGSETQAKLRPDLAVERVAAPRSILAGRRFTVDVEVAEIGGDLAAGTRVSLAGSDGRAVRIRPGGRATVTFDLSLAEAGVAELHVTATPSLHEKVLDNNGGTASIEATEFELSPASVLLPALTGYGGQFNHSLYNPRFNPTMPNPAADLEEKVVALEPQLVRVFFPPLALTDAQRLEAFRDTVDLAQRSGAVINVTWQSNSSSVESNMSRFAGILTDLVRNRGISNLHWVTLLNEPNSTAVPLATYELMYRTLDRHLVALGVREQIRFMGGDLVQDRQREWFAYMAGHMTDVLDAYSVHIFWDYWDTAKLQSRLADVRRILDVELPESARKPVYVMEYGVRGIRRPDGPTGPLVPEPGLWQDRTPMAETRLAGFQYAWFNVLSSKLSYPGTAVWDTFNAKYDNGTQDYSCIGPLASGWSLRPCYHLLRLFTELTEPGWSVVAVDGSAGSKLLTAYTGAAGALTLVGLDTAGAPLNAASPEVVPYSIGGLPPAAELGLRVWNRDGDGSSAQPATVTTDDAGVAHLAVPLHAVWALTTLDEPAG